MLKGMPAGCWATIGLAEELEVGFFAEEVGFVGGQQVDHGLQFVRFGAAGDEAVVLAEAGKPVVLEPPPQAARPAAPSCCRPG
jgi:hypothetical protein